MHLNVSCLGESQNKQCYHCSHPLITALFSSLSHAPSSKMSTSWHRSVHRDGSYKAAEKKQTQLIVFPVGVGGAVPSMFACCLWNGHSPQDFILEAPVQTARMLPAHAGWFVHPDRVQHLTSRQMEMHKGGARITLMRSPASHPSDSNGFTMPQIITISRLPDVLVCLADESSFKGYQGPHYGPTATNESTAHLQGIHIGSSFHPSSSSPHI